MIFISLFSLSTYHYLGRPFLYKYLSLEYYYFLLRLEIAVNDCFRIVDVIGWQPLFQVFVEKN